MIRKFTILTIILVTIFSLSTFAKSGKEKGKGDVKKDTTSNYVGVKFMDGGWFQAANEAKKEGKPIFAFVWSKNCMESMRMLEDIFTDKDVGDFFNENFINYKIDGNDIKNNMRVTAWGVN